MRDALAVLWCTGRSSEELAKTRVLRRERKGSVAPSGQESNEQAKQQPRARAGAKQRNLTPRSFTVSVKPWMYGAKSFRNCVRTPECSRARTRADRGPPPPPSAARIAESPVFTPQADKVVGQENKSEKNNSKKKRTQVHALTKKQITPFRVTPVGTSSSTVEHYTEMCE